MKKFVFGCLFVVILVAIVGGILGYVYVVEPARQYLATFRQLGSLSQYDRDVKNTAAFTPPKSGELTNRMVKRFVAVQDAMQSRLGAQLTQLDERYRKLAKEFEGAKPDARTVFNALHDLGGVLTEAKRIQVEALNASGFSVAEYAWVRDRVYQAAGVTVAGLDFNAIWDAARKGTFDIAAPKKPEPSPVPEQNKALVKPYLDRIDRWLALAWAGL
jgi:hypothetical protein